MPNLNKPKYCYSFICAIADVREIKERNGGLINGNISFVAKKHKIKVKDLRVALKDEGIIK